MDTLILSRILTGLTLGFHIIFAAIGVGVPLFLVIAEGLGIWKKDPHYILLARRWARGLAITVSIGMVTGTIIGLQFSLLWPSFMRVAGHAISLPLFMETLAFFIEAIFLGIYLYTWDRLKPFHHWVLSIPIIMGASLSAVFITTVNAFMNTPAGIAVEKGVLSEIQPLQAIFNPATPSKVAHVLSSSILSSAFILAAIAAYQIIQGKNHIYYKKALRLCMVVGILFACVTAIDGKFSGQFLANYQPEKLAVAEWNFTTQKQAPLLIGGYLAKGNDVSYAIKIPGGLSFFAFGNVNAEVKGLDSVPQKYWPPLFIHYFFDLMILIGIYLMVVSIFYFLSLFKKKGQPKWLMRMIILGGPLSMLAIELGWIFTEMGRQPWVIRGYMTTVSGVTTASGVGVILFMFSVLYFFLGTVCVLTLLRIFRKRTPEREMEERGIN